MLKIKLKLLFILIITTTFLFAHEGHKKKKPVTKPDTLTIVGKDTIAINGMPTEMFMDKQHNEAGENHTESSENEEEVKEVTINAAFEHIHNKVIHFPIALTIIGLLLMVVGYKDDKYLGALKIIIPTAALFTIIAVLSGLNQAEPFEGTATYSLVETHELLGFGVLASLVLWSISFYVKKFRRFIWLFAVLTFVLVSIAGLYGGVIAH